MSFMAHARKEADRGRVIAGFDGSVESKDALRLAKQLTKADAAELHVAFVQWDDNQIAEQRRYDRVLDEAFRTSFGAEFTPHRLRDTSAAHALHELAESINADLIVIGSCHRGAAGRVLFGSVGASLLNGAPCAVAVAPRGYSSGAHLGFGLIGVAYDGWPESKIALAVAVRLASKLECTLQLIGVVPPMFEVSEDPDADAGYQGVLAKELAAAAAEVPRIPVETKLDYGPPAEVLAEHGIELDLLVIGSRGYGPLRRALLGGVSAEVMRTAPCPVLVTPRVAAEPEGRDRERALRGRYGHETVSERGWRSLPTFIRSLRKPIEPKAR